MTTGSGEESPPVIEDEPVLFGGVCRHADARGADLHSLVCIKVLISPKR